MTNIFNRCEGAFIGHAIASKYDPSIYMALNVSESLLDCKGFDGKNILSRHLYLYHTKKCDIGGTTRFIYQELIQKLNQKPSLTREDFNFDESIIDQTVALADKKYDGHTAGCGPAHRSYPLAFCSYVSDEDLFHYSLLEAKLTHFNPLAGQVAGIVNLICRSLLKNESWTDAMNSAFSMPRLHNDIQMIVMHRHRTATPAVETHAGYAPTALGAALHIVGASRNAAEAMAFAKDQPYCAPIVGILAGARWGIPIEILKNNINDEQLKPLHETANKLIELWPVKADSVSV